MTQNNGPTLLWGIDKETGSISALPASPLLLPAIAVLGVLKLFSVVHKPKPKTAPLPAGFNSKEYYSNKREYDYYVEKIKERKELTEYEKMRFNTVLPFPSWSKGEPWHY
jgi:hypothetical protein